MTAPQSAIDQIRALLSKTIENGCTEAEANTAAAIAQKLLTKHRLSVADVRVKKGGAFAHHFSEGGIEKSARIPSWKVTLWGDVCRVNGCFPMLLPCGDRQWTLVAVGEENDAFLVRTFYEYLRDMIEAATKKERPSFNDSGRSRRWGNSFRLGMSTSICRRLKESHNAAKREASTRAIVRLENQLEKVQSWAKEQHPNMRQHEMHPEVDATAYMKGRAEGRRANLSRNVLTEDQ